MNRFIQVIVLSFLFALKQVNAAAPGYRDSLKNCFNTHTYSNDYDGLCLACCDFSETLEQLNFSLKYMEYQQIPGHINKLRSIVNGFQEFAPKMVLLQSAYLYTTHNNLLCNINFILNTNIFPIDVRDDFLASLPSPIYSNDFAGLEKACSAFNETLELLNVCLQSENREQVSNHINKLRTIVNTFQDNEPKLMLLQRGYYHIVSNIFSFNIDFILNENIFPSETVKTFRYFQNLERL